MANNTFRKSLFIGSLSFLAILLLLISTYVIRIHNINEEYYRKYNSNYEVALRKFPYPYKAALAITNDIDNTSTLEEFLEIHKFLNTNEITSMGSGVGLEIGNSFFFYEPPTDAISYFSDDPEVSKTFIRFIKEGSIDILHSYGDKADFTRKDAIMALEELKKKNKCKIDVWIDHDQSVSNFGNYKTFGLGDHPNSIAYHADLTLSHGIKFVWLGNGTMVVGQSVPVTIGTFTTIFDPEHLLHSIVNIIKEFIKHVFAVFGSTRYMALKDNDIIRITELDNGNKAYEFVRFDNYWQGLGTGGDSKGLAYVISQRTLDRLKKVNGYMIVYTHLGRNDECSQYICEESQNALRNLAKEYERGNIYITTTSKLLNYYVICSYLDWSYDNHNGEISIYIYKVQDPVFGSFIPTVHDLEGITFYVPDAIKTNIYLDKKRIENVRRNPADYTKRQSLTITGKI